MIFKKQFKFLTVVFIALSFCHISAFAEAGKQLPEPEPGWQRIDDADSSIVYKGKWTLRSDLPNFTNNTLHFFNSTYDGLDNTINFKFKGSKIRLLCNLNSSLTRKATIEIDGNKIDFNSYGPIHWTQMGPSYTVIYENTDLDFGMHEVKIFTDGTKPGDEGNNCIGLDAIDIDSNGMMVDFNTPILSLNSTEKDIQLSWNNADGIKYIVKRATKANGPYSKIADEISTGTYIDKTALAGVNYYYIISSIINNTEGFQSNEVSGKLKSTGLVLNLEPEKSKIKKNEMVTVDLVIDNISEIAAEDIRIKFDNTKLEFIGFEEIDGMKLIKSVESNSTGELRMIIASKGQNNIVNAKKILLKLKFKGTEKGEALIDIIKGRISDGIELEKDLASIECGKTTILIEDFLDVNNSGGYTLLDLAIDARHLGKLSADLPQYNTDLNGNKIIDEFDLTEIGKFMLENPNYAGNF